MFLIYSFFPHSDEIVTADKEVQFSYGDDTLLFNVMRVINERKHKNSTGNNLSILAEANVMNSNDSNKSKTTSTRYTHSLPDSFFRPFTLILFQAAIHPPD